jgi:hypothetical protein
MTSRDEAMAKPTPEEIAYVEARCNEIRAILRGPLVRETETELAKLQRLLGIKATPQREPAERE